MVKSRAHTKGRKRFDSLRRRPQFCGDVDENHLVSQSSQYPQSSSDLVSAERSEGDNVSPNAGLNISQDLVKAYKARNQRFV